ncbi:MAG: hypothetical protein J6565_01600 [Lactobacillus sp.]|nr:hypothetical protein [Lactobacillus sp.]
MKINKKIISLAIAGVAMLAPMTSQIAVVSADTANTQTDTNKQNTNKAAVTSVNSKKAEPEPKLHSIREKANWSKQHKRANRAFNQLVKQGQKLSPQKQVVLYQKCLKHFQLINTKYTKRFTKQLRAEIKWLKTQILLANDHDEFLPYPAVNNTNKPEKPKSAKTSKEVI